MIPSSIIQNSGKEVTLGKTVAEGEPVGESRNPIFALALVNTSRFLATYRMSIWMTSDADNSVLFVGATNLVRPIVHPRSPPAGTIAKIS